MILALLVLLGCATDAERQASQQRDAEEAAVSRFGEIVAAPAPVVTTSPTPAAATSDPALVAITWDGIGRLHQSFFGETGAVGRLGADLSTTMKTPAKVRIAYDDTAVRGEIHAVADAGALLTPLTADGEVFGLQSLAPITMALARYRSGVAMRYDLRIHNFEVGVESTRGGLRCVISPVKTRPPDGRVISPCVSIGGVATCGELGEAGVRFSPTAASQLRVCLGI